MAFVVGIHYYKTFFKCINYCNNVIYLLRFLMLNKKLRN